MPGTNKTDNGGLMAQHPLQFGATYIVLYSANKYIGGHSDVIAGAAVGNKPIIKQIKKTRTVLEIMAYPGLDGYLCAHWEHLKVRMEEVAARNAYKVALYLKQHPKIEKVYYLGFTAEKNPDQEIIFRKQIPFNGAMVSFDIAGGEKEAFTFLNNLEHIKLAVSLGGTESPADNTASMTHSDVPNKKQTQ